MATPSADQEVTRYDMRLRAERRIADADFDGAEALYREHLSRYPDDFEVLEWLSNSYIRRNRAEMAIAPLERLAKLHADRGADLKAVAAYKRLNKIAPHRLDVYERLAELYAKLELPTEASSQVRVLAQYYKRHGKFQEAERLFDRAIEFSKGERFSSVVKPLAEVPNPVADLPVAGVPVIPTTIDMIVFLCHASEDKQRVHDLAIRLRADGFHPWLDEEELLPGQHWESEIQRAVRRSHVVIICLSTRAVTKAGFLQKEIASALSVLDEQPEVIIFVIPARFEHCEVPSRLQQLHYVDLFSENGYSRLRRALIARAQQLGFIHRAG